MNATHFSTIIEARNYLEARGWQRLSHPRTGRDMLYERGRETMMIMPATGEGWPPGSDPLTSPCRIIPLERPGEPGDGADRIWRVGDRHGLNATYHRTVEGAVWAAMKRLHLDEGDDGAVSERRNRLVGELRATGIASLGRGTLQIRITALTLED